MILFKPIKSIIKKILPFEFQELLKVYIGKYSLRSYSQEGEDMILRRIFEFQSTGFYVDIGAHHPVRFSNTYYFYLKGWRGINIDATPESMKLFYRIRRKDINLEIAISSKKKKLKFYMFNEPALNTFSKKLAQEREKMGRYKIIDIKEVDAIPLSEVLDKYLPAGVEIDFMSIDVEGAEWEVILSNDWFKYKPKVLLIEMLNNNLTDVYNNKITKFLQNNHYLLFAKTFNTVFFMREDLWQKT